MLADAGRKNEGGKEGQTQRKDKLEKRAAFRVNKEGLNAKK